MEGTIHIMNKQEQEYWIDGELVSKVTTSSYVRKFGREAYVHYKSGEVEIIPRVVVIEVFGTYTLKAKPLPTTEEEKADLSEQLSPEMKALLSQEVGELGLLELSTRTRNILKKNGIDTILDLCRLKRTDWLKFRNGGKKSFVELDDFLTARNLTWGMDV
jgi:hypothetical protein